MSICDISKRMTTRIQANEKIPIETPDRPNVTDTDPNTAVDSYTILSFNKY